MSSQKQVTVRDLVEEAKKRIVFLVICVVGLSYLMSLTSSSVLVNLPAAASLIILLRYFSLDFEMRRKAAAYNNKPSSSNVVSQNRTTEGFKVVKWSNWRSKVNSPTVEDAIDGFTRHLVSEWVTDLWYSRLTPDKEGPEELVQIINGVFGEISGRVRNINLINLLTRDLIDLICGHLEVFRASQAKFEKQQSASLTIEDRDMEIRRVLAAEDKLHPALFSAEAEHKVLQCLMDGLISFTFRHEDLQCSFFRYTVRELLACAVIRPVLNLASPRFVNERIESLAMSMGKAKRATVQATSHSEPCGSSKISSENFSAYLDPSVTGVELVQLKSDKPSTSSATSTEVVNGAHISKDPLLSIDTRSTRSWGSLPMDSHTSKNGGIQRHRSGGEWGDMLDQMSRRKTQALAPENFENMWAKGRNYRKKEDENRVIDKISQHSVGKATIPDHTKMTKKPEENDYVTKVSSSKIHATRSGHTEQRAVDNSSPRTDQKISNCSSVVSYEDEEHSFLNSEEVDSGSSTSYTSEDEESGNVTGLDSPGTKVWDGKSNRKLAVSRIHHPLENPGGRVSKKTGRRPVRYQRLSRTQSGRKISKSGSQKLPVWQEVERTSFLSGDGQDILSSSRLANIDVSSDDSDVESLGRSQRGAAASSSASFTPLPESHNMSVNTLKSSLMVESFFKLRCEVLGANIVKSGSKTFAVYSISVTDSNSNSWSIKRRFRHFEELHRRLKFFPEYNLHLPPKHFLSTGLDMPVIQERCKLLDIYLKKLLQLPTISGSIEVWDFLSVDSQTYVFSNSFSIIETLSVDLEDTPSERNQKVLNSVGHTVGPYSPRRENSGTYSKESALQGKDNFVAEGLKAKEMSRPIQHLAKDSSKAPNAMVQNSSSSPRNSGKVSQGRENYGLEETSSLLHDSVNDPALPTEWVPPNLSIPILDLVDVIFQLQDGGWIRRKAFWVAKQVLQLGMGDAFDDWLIEKIQLLRRGSVVASGIKRVEQILWPDGIFITKHPKRRPQPPSSPTQSSPRTQQPAEISSPRLGNDQGEADRRAKFVYELMINKAPAAIVGLVGHKEYEQCAKDLYFFIQSSVCMKQLAFDLLELMLLSAFPEMDYIFKQFHQEKHKFGEYKLE